MSGDCWPDRSLNVEEHGAAASGPREARGREGTERKAGQCSLSSNSQDATQCR